MIHPASTATPRSSRWLAPRAPAKEGEADEPLFPLPLAGLLPEEIGATHALIVADHGLDLLRGLIRRGFLAATWLRLAARPEPAAHDLAIYPEITRDTLLEQVIRDARRSLVPGGRLVAGVTDGTGRTARSLARGLQLNGFVDVRTWVTPRLTWLLASLSDRGAPASQRSAS